MAITKEELRDALTRNGYTAVSFAETWGVHPETVYRWGNGATPRWVLTVLALMDQLGRERVERCGGWRLALEVKRGLDAFNESTRDPEPRRARRSARSGSASNAFEKAES